MGQDFEENDALRHYLSAGHECPRAFSILISEDGRVAIKINKFTRTLVKLYVDQVWYVRGQREGEW